MQILILLILRKDLLTDNMEMYLNYFKDTNEDRIDALTFFFYC